MAFMLEFNDSGDFCFLVSPPFSLRCPFFSFSCLFSLSVIVTCYVTLLTQLFCLSGRFWISFTQTLHICYEEYFSDFSVNDFPFLLEAQVLLVRTKAIDYMLIFY